MNGDHNTVVISIDVEPDIGSWTQGTRGITEGIPLILEVLAKHNAQATFFFTGREAINHPDILEKVISGGHELGCHSMFHETLGNSVFFMPGDSPILDSEIPGRLAMATDTVESACGVRPTSFRAPRLFGSSAMLSVLEDLGYVADSSYPAYFGRHSFAPYHPSRVDWSLSGDMSILEIPPFFDADIVDDDESGRTRDQWPALRLYGDEYFSDLTLRMLDKCKDESGRSVLCTYLHPWEFVEMPAETVTTEVNIAYAPLLTSHCGDFTVNALDKYLETLKQHDISLQTVKHVAQNWG